MSDQPQQPRAITVRPAAAADAYFNPTHWNVMKVMAETFIKSGALPRHIQNAAQLVMIMQTGAELGFKPMQSINALYIVNGRVAMQSTAMASKLLESGVKMKWLKDTAEEASVEFSGLDRTPYVSTFTFDDAKKAGLTSKMDSPWLKYPKPMLRARAVSAGAKVFCPDILMGTYTLEEVAEVTVGEDGQETFNGAKDLDHPNTTVKVPDVPKGNRAIPPKEDPNLEIKRLIAAECRRLGVDVYDPEFKAKIKNSTGKDIEDPLNLPDILDALKSVPTPKAPPKNPTPPAAPTTPNAPKPTPEQGSGPNQSVNQPQDESKEPAAAETPADPEWIEPKKPEAVQGEVLPAKQPEETPEQRIARNAAARAKDIERREALPLDESADTKSLNLFRTLLEQKEGVPADDTNSQLGYLSLVQEIDIDKLDQLTRAELSRINKQLLNQKSKKE